MTQLQGAIIGCVMIAEYHRRAWLRIPEVQSHRRTMHQAEPTPR